MHTQYESLTINAACLPHFHILLDRQVHGLLAHVVDSVDVRSSVQLCPHIPPKKHLNDPPLLQPHIRRCNCFMSSGRWLCPADDERLDTLWDRLSQVPSPQVFLLLICKIGLK